jgi:hypothetical protein
MSVPVSYRGTCTETVSKRVLRREQGTREAHLSHKACESLAFWSSLGVRTSGRPRALAPLCPLPLTYSHLQRHQPPVLPTRFWNFDFFTFMASIHGSHPLGVSIWFKVYYQDFFWVLIDLIVELLVLIIKPFDNQTENWNPVSNDLINKSFDISFDNQW